ncbi:MAG: sigma-54 dependent transcriptional regulator [Pedobacter sp.]
MKPRVLIVEDDNTFRSLLRKILSAEGLDVHEVASAEEGIAKLRRESFDLVLSDLKLPGMNGLDLFRASRTDVALTPFILMTAFGTIEEAVDAMKEGVLDFITKPLKDPNALRTVVRKALEGSRREREYLSLKETESAGLPPEELIFVGNAMADVRRLIGEGAPTQATVLIQGESGTGKELVARTVHLLSPRRNAGFVAVNCAAIPENLLESELFGHERGAFTGAIQARLGKFELAQGGTIFLDEIGELPLALQAKLLRVIQERRFERVGGNKEITADVRIVAATNRSLFQEVQEKRFREDLFYRINVFPVILPPLRDRTDAIATLVNHFIGRFVRMTGKPISGIESAALKMLLQYPWPGNIRELQNAIERAVILGRGVLTCNDFQENFHTHETEIDKGSLLEEAERETILQTLKSCGNNRRIAADKLGVSKRTLQYRLKRYGLVGEE